MQYKTHYRWPSVGHLSDFINNVEREAKKVCMPLKAITLELEGTVKLNGVNVGIVCKVDENDKPYIYYQNKEEVLNEDNDVHQFLNFIEEEKTKEFFLKALWDETRRVKNTYKSKHGKLDAVVLHGEFVGKGVKEGTAVSDIKPFIAPFSLSYYFKDNNGKEHVVHNTDSYNLTRLYKSYLKDLRCYPVTLSSPVVRKVRLDEESLKNFEKEMNEMNKKAKDHCPFAKLFGKEGSGEGYIWKVKFHSVGILGHLHYMFK